jgi:hypothetical protein
MTKEQTAQALDLDQLEKLADAATPGTWEVRSMRGMPSFIQAPRIDPEHPYDIELLGEDDTLYPTREADLQYIVAVQPQVLKQLITEVRAARQGK